MQIFEKEPSDWQDLQVKVAKLFADLNFTVEVEKDIKTARETVNVDVIANYNSFPKESILVECKFWTSAIPKTIIHAFRTVVGDYGANTGYIISRNGFQQGAYEATSNSNIVLMTFGEFQEAFRERYVSEAVNRLQKVGYPLRRYADWSESAFDKEIDKLSPEKKERFKNLQLRYNDISLSSVWIGLYKSVITGELDMESVDHTVERVRQYVKDKKINCYSDYFDYLINLFKVGLQEFDDLFGKQLRKN
jgi:predicted helicase